MKTIITLLFFLLSLSIQAQWELNQYHAAFRSMDAGIDEFSHWTPFDITFWTDPPTYQNGVELNPTELRFFNNLGGGSMNRITLDANGLTVVNNADWLAFTLGLNGAQGSLLLTNGSGQTRSINYGGVQRLYGADNSENIYLGYFNSSNLGNGYVAVQDASNIAQAGLYVNASGDGVVFGDTKTFKVPHPKKEDMDIWYACIEGPEAAIYDRGTATLTNGEAFIPFSDHYASMVSEGSTTIQLTPNEWDTYGLAVTKKTSKGFYVKELKGGNGNFMFDWEAKSVRKGKEDFQVLRPKDFLKTYDSVEVEKTETPQTKTRAATTHKHSEGCVHNKKN